MPENNVSDPITDQEIAFVHLILSGTVTDRRAAKAVGLNPNTAPNIKSKPRVAAYMQERRAVQQQQPVEQSMEGQSPLIPTRARILARLWEIANLSHEMTRNSITSQVKAISMIIAIEGMIPDRRAAVAQNQPAPPPATAQIYQAQWLREQRGKNVAPGPAVQEEASSESPSAPDTISSPIPEPTPDLSESTAILNPEPTPSMAPRVPMADYVAPDTRVPRSLSMRMGRLGRRG